MCPQPMPTTSIVILAGALVALMIPLVALEVLSDMFPRVQDYKGWLSVLLWAAVIAVVYFVLAPSLGLSGGE
jgi:uncharacterized protein involved in cysteine biosynthesis